MNSENFAYWLQGYFEMVAAGDDFGDGLTPEQVACIKDHLALVFEKVTPNRQSQEEKDVPAVGVCSASTLKTEVDISDKQITTKKTGKLPSLPSPHTWRGDRTVFC